MQPGKYSLHLKIYKTQFMEKIFSKAFAVIFLLSSFITVNAKAQDGYNLKFTIKNLKEGSKCLLANYYGGSQYKQDSATSNAKGEIMFKGTEKYPQGIYLIIIPSKRYFDFVMDAGQHFSMETDTLDFVKNMKVKGSDENKYLYDFQNFMFQMQKKVEPLQADYKRVKDKNKDSAKIVQAKMAALDKEVKDYKANFIKNNPKSFIATLFKAMHEPEIPEAPVMADGKKDTLFNYHYYKTHFFDQVDFSDARLLRTPVFHAKIKQYLDKLTPQIPDSVMISVDYIVEKSRANPDMYEYLMKWMTYNYETSKIMGMDAVFSHMVEKYYATKQVTWLDSAHMFKVVDKGLTLKYTLIGQKAPPINMQDSTGKKVALYDVKSKYTVVVFWEQGCGHCKKEIPHLMELYNTKLKAKGVEVYAIESEEKEKDWRKFLVENKLHWINVWEPDEYKRAVAKKYYMVESTPTMFLLDENKIIKAKKVDADQLEMIIDRLEKDKEKK